MQDSSDLLIQTWKKSILYLCKIIVLGPSDDKSIIFFDPDKTFHKAKGEQCKRAFERIWRHFQCLLPTAHIRKKIVSNGEYIICWNKKKFIMDPNMNVGSSQDFRLTWVNYSQKLTESFHKFLTSEILCNVTLWVHENGGGNSIKAHQAILSACSPWFEKILSQNQHPHPIIILKDVRYHDLKNIIRY